MLSKVKYLLFIILPFVSIPLANSQEYKINTGDILTITITPAEELSREVSVKPDGTVNLPLIGDIKAANLTPKELSGILQNAYSVYVIKPKVNVSVKYYSRKQVLILGEITKPGSYDYTEGLRLFDVITQAGGLRPSGSTTVKIYRGEPDKRQTLSFDLDNIIRSGDFTKDFVLQPGDIIEIPLKPKTISVIGAVVHPGTYNWHDGLQTLQAISGAGGPKEDAKLSSVVVFRQEKDKQKPIRVNMDKILSGKTEHDIKLEPGDVVFVPAKKITAAKTVSSLSAWLYMTTLLLSVVMTIILLGRK